MSVALDLALALLVGASWLSALAFLRLKTPMQRLHCSAFVTIAGGFFLFVAVALQDGATSRTFKTAILVLTATVVSAASTHAVGRALQLRDAEER